MASAPAESGVRHPATYRVARRKLAREIMRRLKAESKPRDWRSVWLAVEGAHRMARTTNEGSKS